MGFAAKIIIVFCLFFFPFLFLGTSGSRTPDDDLDSSQFEGPRELSSPQPPNENLAEDRSTVTKESVNLNMSRSPSSHSVAPSFSSDIPDSLLPDLSDNVESDKVKSSKGVGLLEEVSKTTDLRTWSCSGESKDGSRPRTLARVKRNSDLPGRVQRTEDFNAGFFPTGIKSSNSDTSLNKDPYAIEEELTLITKAKDAESMVESSLNGELTSAQESDDREPTNITRDEGFSPVDGGARQKTVSTQVLISPVQSPTNPDLPSPVKTPPPPVSKKPSRTPTKEAKEFVPAAKSSPEEVQSSAEVPGGEPRELIVPVMTALQERRPSTPDCSSAKGSKNDIKEKEERVKSPGEKDLADDKKAEVKALTRSSYTTRVSVKDRKQQYERNRSAGAELGRKQSSELFTPVTVASRKQLFERGERAGYKRVEEINTRKPRSDSGSGSSSASSSPKVAREGVNGTEETNNSNPVSGSPKFRRKRMNDSGDARNAKDAGTSTQGSSEKTKPVEQDKHVEPRRRRKNGNPEKSDCPPSLVVDNGDKTRSGDLDSLKLDLHDIEKETLTTRNIEIPSEEHLNERHRSERPRKSPNNSPRSNRGSARTPFPEDSTGEGREPQFV